MQRRRVKQGSFRWRGLVLVTLVLATLCAAAWHARLPWQTGFQQRSRAVQLRQDVRSEKHTNDHLKRERDDLLTPGGREAKARSQGYLRPGEELLNTPKGR